MSHNVGDVSRLSGVSIRALHHYDAIGLLRPSGRTRAGYRQYTEADLEKLQQILFYRELGFPLDDIQRVLQAPDFDRGEALRAQRELLVEKRGRLDAMVGLVDRALEAIEKGTPMKEEEMFAPFDPSAYAEEAKARWGGTPSYAESQRRTKGYTKDDWAAIAAEVDSIERDFEGALAAGLSPADERPRSIAERHRAHIDKWFYPCSREMHAALGAMYVQDERFAQHYDKRREGLAQFVSDAVQANARA
ncbi:MAG TPA: MerR family transcriptional regulator [Polyangiaceae bacterium]|jgi:DNA-binding transcriptional MerR regulator